MVLRGPCFADRSPLAKTPTAALRGLRLLELDVSVVIIAPKGLGL